MNWDFLGALGAGMQSFGGSMQQEQEQKRLDAAEKAKKAAEDARVASRSKPYKRPTPSQYAPWIDKAAKGYMGPTGGADEYVVDEFNSQGKVIGTRLAAPSEEGEVKAYEQANALAMQQEQAKADRQAMLDNSRLNKEAAQAAASRATAAQKADRMNNPDKYKSQGKGSEPKMPDYDKELTNLDKLQAMEQGKGEAADGKVVSMLDQVKADARAVSNGGTVDGTDYSKFSAAERAAIAAQILKTGMRDYRNRSRGGLASPVQ